MGEGRMIQVLDDKTIDKIAAGEVVERPSSVVKELLENALDAGSTAVSVEIKNGGIDLIRVTDNGSGIPRAQVRTAFLPHATSKLRSIEDLYTLNSLGFRGEALPSIAAVSRVEMMTKPATSDTGTRYVMDGGEEKSIEEVGVPNGTTFVVKDLFLHTPARRKFLKSAMTEAGYVTSLVEEIALSRPDVSFKYTVNGTVKLVTQGNGNLKDVIYHIYGRDIAEALIPTEFEQNGMSLSGFIAKPVIARNSRNMENYFVNGRYVKDRLVAKALEDGYVGFLMQHKFPFVVLKITVPPESLDINVHPRKMEVKFSEGAAVYDFLRESIQKTLSGREHIRSFTPGRRAERSQPPRPSQKAPEPFERRSRNSYSEMGKPLHTDTSQKPSASSGLFRESSDGLYKTGTVNDSLDQRGGGILSRNLTENRKDGNAGAQGGSSILSGQTEYRKDGDAGRQGGAGILSVQTEYRKDGDAGTQGGASILSGQQGGVSVPQNGGGVLSGQTEYRKDGDAGTQEGVGILSGQKGGVSVPQNGGGVLSVQTENRKGGAWAGENGTSLLSSSSESREAGPGGEFAESIPSDLIRTDAGSDSSLLNSATLLNPDAGSTEGDLLNPNSTMKPDGTMNPNAALGPDGTMNPNASLGPDGTMNPNAALRPDGSMNPGFLLGPDGTMNPNAVLGPDGTMNSQLASESPEQMNLFGEKLLTADAAQEYRIVGQVFGTFWIVEYRDTLLYIDQHAAHEKVRYEHFMKQFEEREVVTQLCSPPIIITLDGQHRAVLEKFMDRFLEMGFEIEPFGGNEYAIRAVPEDLYGLTEKEVLISLLDELSEGRGLSDMSAIHDRIATMACKAAIKGNTRYSFAEAEALIKELLTLKEPYHCPHGRPTIIKMSKRDLEKQFKRIV
ncbi:MAG: DNA mismatch repair endonuclease MutL [Lachnospiraceae bacterium]|nr:DNA mismatch repair endonuclease MutL [Lachnospiraceae bacterium]